MKERAKALGFKTTAQMVESTGYSNSTLWKLKKENEQKFNAITLAAMLKPLTIEQFKNACKAFPKLANKRLIDMSNEELKYFFGEAI